MTFDYSKLTALDMLEFHLICTRGQWGVSAGILTLVAKTGVDLAQVPASKTTKIIEDFWRGFPEHVKQVALEQLFKGEKNDTNKQ